MPVPLQFQLSLSQNARTYDYPFVMFISNYRAYHHARLGVDEIVVFLVLSLAINFLFVFYTDADMRAYE